jgi:hypothetical protein
MYRLFALVAGLMATISVGIAVAAVKPFSSHESTRAAARAAARSALASQPQTMPAVHTGRKSHAGHTVRAKSSAVATLDENFALFRRASRPEDQVPYTPQDSISRKSIASDGTPIYLRHNAKDLCVGVAGSGGGGEACGPLANALTRPVMVEAEGGTGTMLVGVVPDSVNSIAFATETGESSKVQVQGNVFVVRAQGRLTSLDWVLQDGRTYNRLK